MHHSRPCTRARADQAHYFVDQNIALNKKVIDKTIEPHAARVVMDNNKWIAAKLAPREYGDRATLALVDADGGSLLQIGREERQARIKELEAKRGLNGAPQGLIIDSTAMLVSPKDDEPDQGAGGGSLN